ncbi:hypothetical protein IBE76_10075, partial [Francisella tularensis]|uniref:hypothetical protein n=1 Tax=Francisella tularensis TaxID=263 RepID=UPI001C0ECAA5
MESKRLSKNIKITDQISSETSKGFTRDLIRDYDIGANPFFRKFNSMDGVEETIKKYQNHG